MAYSGQYYPDNHVNVHSESTMKMTLSMKRSWGDSSDVGTSWHVSTPTTAIALPIRSARPVEVTEMLPNLTCGTVEAAELANNQGSAVASVKQESHRSSSTEYLRLGEGVSDTPSTFVFGPPGGHEPRMMSPPPIKVEAEDPAGSSSTKIVRNTMNKGRKTSYDAETMADFQQHLNIIDCTTNYPKLWTNSELERSIPPPTDQQYALQDYQMQLMLLEQQNKKRKLMAKQERKAMPISPPPVPNPPPRTIRVPGSTLREYQMQLMLLDQQKRKRLSLAEQENKQEVKQEIKQGIKQEIKQEPQQMPLPSSCSQFRQCQHIQVQDTSWVGQQQQQQQTQDHAVKQEFESTPMADRSYQIQLMLLEQQNKIRLMQTRQQQPFESIPPADRDYQMQLMLLEQQNKKRLMQARQEEDAGTPEYRQVLKARRAQEEAERLRTLSHNF